MAEYVAQFLQIIGSDITPPTTMYELIPYLLTVFIGLFLVESVFRVIGAIAKTFTGFGGRF